jgi:predicted negative regulator of RcsB-dependent stress response
MPGAGCRGKLGPNPTIQALTPDTMANNLDLEEQEQLDQIKHFWKQHGNWISWVLIVVFGGIAGWNAYQYWQRSQATQAAGLYDEVDRAARTADLVKLEQALADMQGRYGGTVYAQQASLLAAGTLADKGKPEQARAALGWVVDKASDEGYKAVARLRLAALLVEIKGYDEALKQLDGVTLKEFAPLAADRRGDIFSLQGQPAKAKEEYLKAHAGLKESGEYRRLVEVKLNALGVDPVSTDKPASSEAKKP